MNRGLTFSLLEPGIICSSSSECACLVTSGWGSLQSTRDLTSFNLVFSVLGPDIYPEVI